jgi:hypothetical protein
METKEVLLIAVLGVALWFVLRQKQAQAQAVANAPNLTNTITGAVGAGATVLRNTSSALMGAPRAVGSILSAASHNPIAAAALAPPIAATSAILHPVSTVKSVGSFIGGLF